MQNVYIVGAKGIPAAYGGYESFVDKLTFYKKSKDLQYHVACAVDGGDDTSDFIYNNARCFRIPWKKIGSARAIFYDTDAIENCIDHIRSNHIEHPILYILACRIGPFMKKYVRKIHRLGGEVYVNPDGHEWKRAKWSKPVRQYWKTSERLMVKQADLLICDSINIENYIKTQYKKYRPKTTYIAYGAETRKSTLADQDEKLLGWYREKNVRANEYYLVVGRFVPENNYEVMIREFMKSDTQKDFVLITNVEKNAFYEGLLEKTHFDQDKRIKFVGTVYDQELIKKIRENAYAYLHGHEVGGTNPSLLEAMGSTNLNLLLGVGFNKEVGENAALYWNKKDGDLAALINRADGMSPTEIAELGKAAKERIATAYSWDYIVGRYEKVFLNQ